MSDPIQPFEVLAYYYFAKLEDPHLEVARHREFLEGKDIRCRVYISEEGINGQMSASREACSFTRNGLNQIRDLQVLFSRSTTIPNMRSPGLLSNTASSLLPWMFLSI